MIRHHASLATAHGMLSGGFKLDEAATSQDLSSLRDASLALASGELVEELGYHYWFRSQRAAMTHS